MKMPKLGTLNLIDKAILENQKPVRKRIGCSQAGEECEYKLFMDLHNPQLIDDPRILRIFELGNQVETVVINLLKQAGVNVFERDDRGNQFGVSFLDGLLCGSVDAVVTGIPESEKAHVLEIKSYNNARFNTLCKESVSKSDPKYYTQVQLYLKGLNLEKALFIAYNKDTSDLYEERIDYDPFEAEIAINKVDKVLKSKDGSNLDKSKGYKCRFCLHKEKCDASS